MTCAVVLAAGEGARAWPFSGIRQKVTVPVLNTPMIRRLVLDLLAVGIEDVVVVVGHRAEAVRGCLGDLTAVRFVDQPVRTGPVDAALRGLTATTGETALVCFGDIVTSRESLRSALETYSGRKAQALLLAAPCPAGLTASCTAVEATPDGLLREVWGRGTPEHPRFAGVAIARTDLFARYLERNPGIPGNAPLGSMPPVEGDLAYSFELMRQDGIEVHVAMIKDFFVDVDKPWHILEANHRASRHFFDGMDKTTIEPGAAIHDGADIAAGAKLWLGPGAHIGKGCRIEGNAVLGAGARVTDGALLGRNVFIGAESECLDYCQVGAESVIGAHCRVGHCAEFCGVLFDVVFLTHYSSVTALIGTRVDIGAATVCGTWRFDDGARVQVVQGHKEKPECFDAFTYVGDYCRTGVNAMFMPGVKVGYYSCVGPGALVYDDVPERTLLLVKQEHLLKPWGPEQYGW